MRKGCDAALLDLHGAMVIEDCDDAEGEIVKRLRAIAPDLPIAVTLDYHTNLSADLVDNATVITGYKTYPHVDMYDVGKLAGDIMMRTLAGRDRAGHGMGLVAAARVDHASCARRRTLRRHRALRARDGSERQRAGRDVPRVVPTRRHALHGRIGHRRRRCEARWRRGREGSMRSHARDRFKAARRVRIRRSAAGGIGRAGEATRRGGDARAPCC